MTGSLDWLQNEEQIVRDRLVKSLSAGEKSEFKYHWKNFARASQLPPEADWRIWLIIAGRGFGKTRAGAEWVRSTAESHPNARIALISSSLTEARSVMVEGESGILASYGPEGCPTFEPSLRRLKFPNGAQAQLFSAAEPESLRGPQHSHACRAEFCAPKCGLSAVKFTSIEQLSAFNLDANTAEFAGINVANFIDGKVRFLDGPQSGIVFGVLATDGANLILDRPLAEGLEVGMKAELSEGCDHTHTTCRDRFGNLVNFRGEPHLPGNDLLARYG
ncbi:MAG: phage BR0599 family protein [Pseudomonadota bacterium]